MLVLIGATPEGKKELLGFQAGLRESAQSWKELLVDLKARGLSIAPEIAVGDGALGFWKALDEALPSTRHQRCWQHKTLNVLDKLPKSVQPNADKDLREIWLSRTGRRLRPPCKPSPRNTRPNTTNRREWLGALHRDCLPLPLPIAVGHDHSSGIQQEQAHA